MLRCRKILGQKKINPKAFPRFGGTNDKARVIHGNLEDTAHREDNVKTMWPWDFALLPAGIIGMPKVLCFGHPPKEILFLIRIYILWPPCWAGFCLRAACMIHKCSVSLCLVCPKVFPAPLPPSLTVLFSPFHSHVPVVIGVGESTDWGWLGRDQMLPYNPKALEESVSCP